MSKGSTQRPYDMERFDREWDRIFGSAAKKFYEVLQSEEEHGSIIERVARPEKSEPPENPA